MADDKPPVSNKLFLFAAVALIAALFGGIAIAFYLGAFSSVALDKGVAARLTGACVDLKGSYRDGDKAFDAMKQELERANIAHGNAFGIYYDDPSKTEESQLRSKACFALTGDVAVLPDPMGRFEFPQREALIATFTGSPAIGSYKAYPEMVRWGQINGYALALPGVEIYHDEGHRIEYQLGISKIEE